MRRLIFVAVLAAVTALVFGVLGEESGKVEATHTVTITAEANGALTPPTLGTSCLSVTNPPSFTINCTVPVGSTTTGDGIDDVTTWTLDFTNEDNFQECFAGVLTSALLTLTLTPKASLFTNDSVGIPGGGGILISSSTWSPPFLPSFSLGTPKTATVSLISNPDSSLTATDIKAEFNGAFAATSGSVITGEFAATGAGEIRMRYQDDAIVSFAQLELTCEVAHVIGDKMYWTDAGTKKFQRANLDGTEVTDLITTGLVTPLHIALDRVERQMYWIDGNSADTFQNIQRAAMVVNPDVENLLNGSTSDRVGLALDLVSNPQKMYWTDFLGARIKRANIAVSPVEEPLVTTPCCPVDIALDVGAGKMYWTLRLGVDRIQRANLNGTGVETLLTFPPASDPRGIALDLVEREMYWLDNGDNTIKRAPMPVSPVGPPPVVTTLVTGLFEPLEIALDVFDRKMYWTDNGNDTIKRANMDGIVVVEPLVTTGLDRPIGIALDVAQPDGDDDGDGLTDLFEDGFGCLDGINITNTNPDSVPPDRVSSTGTAAEGSTITTGDLTVEFPAGTECLDPDKEIEIKLFGPPPKVEISGVELPAGKFKTVKMLVDSQNVVCIADIPEATIDTVSSCVGLVKMFIPTTLNTSITDDVNGGSTDFKVTLISTGPDTITIEGLVHTAIAAVVLPGPVGGIAELPDVDALSQEAAESGGGSSLLYGVVAGAAAAAVALVAAGGWYARRRWLR